MARSFPAALFCLAASFPAAAAPPVVKNLVADYGAGEKNNEISEILQKAVDDVGALGGGTVVIPGRAGGWNVARPVVVGSPGVTVTGEGAGTRLNGGPVLFVLGLRRPSLADGQFVLLKGLLDGSVKDARYGLRTWDGKTAASGYFQESPLAYAGDVPHDPSGDYWKDYARGTGKPTYWAGDLQYTLNLAVVNNSDGPMKGTVCGVGPGGLSPETTRGGIDDPLDVWTIESNSTDGKDLRFCFRVIDGEGKESVRSLTLAKDGAGPGLHRIGVQLDFTTGRCRAWFGAGGPPVLTDKLDLPRGCRLKAFEYGAFRLGRVALSPFAGSPHGGDSGDWTYCGCSMFETLRYDLDGDHDRLGAPQVAADPKATAADAYRFFPRAGEPGLMAFLPLTAHAVDGLVAFQAGPSGGNRVGYGFWLPARPPDSVPGTITLRDLQMFGGVTVGPAQHVVIEDVYQGGGGYYHGVGTMNGCPVEDVLEVRNCRLIGADAALYDHGATVHATDVSGGGGELMFRFVGGRGWVDHVVITGFVAADYYVKLHAGAVGGPLRFSEFCSDNEGFSFAPRRACFYAEPSADGGKEGNRLSLRGSVYTGALFGKKAVVELADGPGRAVLDVDGIDLWAGKEPLDSVVLCRSPKWSGRLTAQDDWVKHTENGLIHFTGEGRCQVVSYQEADALPAEGTWREGCHVVRIPDHADPQTGAWVFKSYRCVHSGVYGSADEPRWQEFSEKP